jgi:hypothetical protein
MQGEREDGGNDGRAQEDAVGRSGKSTEDNRRRRRHRDHHQYNYICIVRVVRVIDFTGAPVTTTTVFLVRAC